MSSAPEQLIADFRRAGHDYARKRASLEAAEHYRKVLLAILMSSCGETSVAAQEREALKSPEYAGHLAKLRQCVEMEQKAKTDMRAAEYQIEVWRTEQATERMERKSYAA